MNNTRMRPAAIIAALAALTLAGCASPPPSATPTTAPSSEGGLVTSDIVIGTGGQLSNADVFAAIADGHLEDQGLTATTQILTAGSNAIPQLLSGELTFATVDMTTAINATQQNVGITVVAPNTNGVPDDIGYAMVVAGADSGIDSPSSLEGKKVQVNQLGGTAQVLTEASIEKDGGDPSTVQFVEIAPPQALSALQAGQVDAIVVGEPITAAAEALGFTAVFNPEQNTVPNLPTFVFVTSSAYAEQNPEVVAQFQKAVLATNKALNADPDHVREIAKSSTEVPEEVLAQVKGLPLFGETTITGEQVQEYIDLLVEYGALDADAVPAGSDVLWNP